MIELLTVIGILGILSIFVMGNFTRSLLKARDSRRKQDLDQVRSALDIYYAKHESYPLNSGTYGLPWGSPLTDGTRTFMEKLPNDPQDDKTYFYASDGFYYQLFSCLENTQDLEYRTLGATPEGTIPDCDAGCENVCHYGVSSSNSQIQ